MKQWSSSRQPWAWPGGDPSSATLTGSKAPGAPWLLSLGRARRSPHPGAAGSWAREARRGAVLCVTGRVAAGLASPSRGCTVRSAWSQRGIPSCLLTLPVSPPESHPTSRTRPDHGAASESRHDWQSCDPYENQPGLTTCCHLSAENPNTCLASASRLKPVSL